MCTVDEDWSFMHDEFLNNNDDDDNKKTSGHYNDSDDNNNKTGGQSNLTAYGWFNRICQVVPVFTPI